MEGLVCCQPVRHHVFNRFYYPADLHVFRKLYQAYQELENYYNNGVTIEVIADYASDYSGGIRIYPVVYNGENRNPVYPWVSSGNSEQLGGAGTYIPATTGVLSQGYEWYVRVNPGAQIPA